MIDEHMPAAHRAHREWTPERLRRWAQDIGPATRRVDDQLLTDKPHPEMGYRSCLGLPKLARDHSKSRLEAACQRALLIGSPNRKSVQSILKGGLDQQPLPPPAQTDWVSPEHDNLRGPAEFTASLTHH